MIWNDWQLTPERIAVHLPTATGVVADLHLGYHEARQRSGEMVPLVSVAQQLEPFARVAMKRVIVAGDLFERGFDAGVYSEWTRELDRLGLEWLGLVPGNHDRIGNDSPVSLLASDFRLGEWQIVHGDGELPSGKVVLGHFHPSMWSHGRKRACYLMRDDRLILPAYSREAAGVNIHGDPRWQGYTTFATR